MYGMHHIALEGHAGSKDAARANVSAFFEDGDEVVVAVVGYANAGYLTAWTRDSLAEEIAGLEAVLASGKGDEFEADFAIALKRALDSSHAERIEEGRLGLEEGHLCQLGLHVGDELYAIGAGTHIELWNPRLWEEGTSLVDDLAELLGGEQGTG